MRRFWIVSMAIAVALAMAAPVAAKRPTEATYTVDIAVGGDGEGISTTCLNGQGNLLVLEANRRDERRGRVSHFESQGATLSIDTAPPALVWEGAEVVGCSGTLATPEYFRITLHDDGSVAMLWIFDVAVDETTVTLKNGKVKTETSRTDLRMGGPYTASGDFATAIGWDDDPAWEAEDGSITFTVTGAFSFVHYESGADPLFVELDNSPRPGDFTLEVKLTPKDS